MPQMLRLSQGHWLNLDRIVEIYEAGDRLCIVCAALALNEHNHPDTYTLYLGDEERNVVLAWLDITEAQLQRWYNGTVAQVAFAHLPKELREFIITGITNEEWQTLKSEEDA